MKCEYEKLTIENVETAFENGYITEMICDGDTKTISIDSNEIKMLEKVVRNMYESIKGVVEATWNLCKSICISENEVLNNLSVALGGKLTKKKFIKLLQSRGIQRNEINKIIQYNKQPYTYFRLNTILNEKNK